MKRINMRPVLFGLAGILALTSLPAVAQTADDTGYGFFRTVEGSIRLTTFDKAEPIEVEPNYPVLTGDRLWVAPGSRVEMILPDRTVVRVDGSTDLYLEALALSADSDENGQTVMNLLEGEIQVRVESFFSGLEAARVDTVNASVFLQAEGSYRIGSQAGYSQVVVRDGFAEVRTDRGSVIVRAGEEAQIDGDQSPRVGLGTAAGYSDLELWGSELDGYVLAGESARELDPSLAYAAAPLDEHGDWVYAGGRRAWRPRVQVQWRPYTEGWWVYTPSGLSWVSYDPFGWVTSHYGTWDLYPGYGWLWYPGAVYSPAWVYWYWGPTHTAWIPAGYYSHFYLYGNPGYASALYFGVYGWAGGGWGSYSYWTFCPTRYFGRRGYRAYWRSGEDLRDYGRLRAVPRGVITADTRPLHPGRWGKPTEAIDALRRAAPRDRLDRVGGDLRDVTDFVERRAQLKPDTRDLVFRERRIDERPTDRIVSGRRVAGAEAPWRPEKPLRRDEVDVRMSDGGLRDAAVSRGSRIDDLRDSRSRSSLTGRSPYADKMPAAPRSPADRSSIERYRVGREEPARALPPSGRSALPSVTYVRPDRQSTDQMPVVRRILEGVRSGGAPSVSRPVDGSSGGVRDNRGGSSAPPTARPDSSSSSKPSARPGSSSSSRQPTVRSNPPSRSSPSTRPGSSRGSSGSKSSGGARSRSRKDG